MREDAGPRAGSPPAPWRRAVPLLVVFGLPFLYVALFMVYPYLSFVEFSFYRVESFAVVHEFGLGNYVRALTTSLYPTVLLTTFKVALIVTAGTLLVAFPLAYYVVFVAGARRQLLYFLIIVPLWTSFLLRVYMWKLILGRSGLINGALLKAGIIDHPLSILLYNQFSLCLTLIYTLVPFVVLPIYTALERIPPRYLEASLDLGARPWPTFRRIILPLAMPGIVTGAIFAFCLSFGDFVTPALVGGASSNMIANLIVGQFGAAFDWPFGSALAVLVFAVILVVVALGSLVERDKGYRIA